jgi:hypothetical protein
VWTLCEGFATPVFRWQPLSPSGVRVKGFSKAPGAFTFAWEAVGEKVPVVYAKGRLSDSEWVPLTNGVGVAVHMRSDGATLVFDSQSEASPYRFFTVIVP